LSLPLSSQKKETPDKYQILKKTMKTRTTSSCLIALLLTCFGFFPRAQAVITDPEGYFPGWNTADGQNALFSLTSGVHNTALGGQALYRNTTGNNNTAVGLNALFNNTTAFCNTAIGAAALYFNTGALNTATGYGALRGNTTGNANTASGCQALYFNSTGASNTANGADALQSNRTGSKNTATGYQALYRNTVDENTAMGYRALYSNTDGNRNAANGVEALYSNVSGSHNTANGYRALRGNSSGSYNTANGASTLASNFSGSYNTATGYRALDSNVEGNYNTAVGHLALNSTRTSSNTAIGYAALGNFVGTFGFGGNIALGNEAGSNVTTASNVIAIGSPGANWGTSCFIGNIRGITTAHNNAIPVLIDSAGQLGTMSSSRRFKKEIKPMDRTSEAILALKPVTFQYKTDKEGMSQFGLIAEEVAKVDPDLVVRDENGELYTVRYEAINAMLLNEFLKEHRKNEEQQATIAQLKSTDAKQEATIAKQQKQIEALTAGLQKVRRASRHRKPFSTIRKVISRPRMPKQVEGKPKLMKNRNTITIFKTILLVCFGFLPRAQAVVPAPDGDYPGGNTAEGQNALLSLTTGVHNTAVGYFSLKSASLAATTPRLDPGRYSGALQMEIPPLAHSRF
jgi:uncharacterized coiled-coil protein SlyX